MHSITFCSINSVSSVFTLNKFQKEKVHFKYPDNALNQKQNEVWNVGHFMQSTVAALITSRRGRGYQTLIINDKITL